MCARIGFAKLQFFFFAYVYFSKKLPRKMNYMGKYLSNCQNMSNFAKINYREYEKSNICNCSNCCCVSS